MTQTGMWGPIPDAVVFFVLIALLYVLDFTGFYLAAKVRRYKRELEKLRLQLHSPDENNLTRPQISASTKTTTSTKSSGDDM